MKYTTSVTIAQSREQVVELFDSTDNLYEWMDGLQSFTHQSGDPGQPGAKSKLVFKMGKRDVTMIETIIRRDFPDSFGATYEASGVWNGVNNEFAEAGEGKTTWTAHHEFRFKGFMAIMAFFMHSAFKKQTRKTMEAFREFAERS